MGGKDKKRKRSKTENSVGTPLEDDDTRTATSSLLLEKEELYEEINDEVGTEVSRKSKKVKKEKKDKEDSKKSKDRKEEKKAMKDKKDKEEIDKGDRKIKSEKKEKKETKEKKDKKKKSKKQKDRSTSTSSSSSHSSPSSDNDTFVNSMEASSLDSETSDMELDVNVEPITAAVEQETIRSVVEIMVQETVSDHEKEIRKEKKDKKDKKEKKEKKRQDEELKAATFTSMNSSTSAVASTSKSIDNANNCDTQDEEDDTGVPIKQSELKDESAGLTKNQRRILKAKQKQLNRKSEGDGEPAFLINDGHERLTLKDLRDLVVFILTETPSLPWIQVKNKFNIDKVLLLYVAGLDPQLFHLSLKASDVHKSVSWIDRATMYGGPVQEFEHLQEHFEEVHIVMATGDRNRIFSPTNTLLNVPLSNAEKTKRDNEKKNQLGGRMKPENYMVSLEELRENNFPLPSYLDTKGEAPELPEGWIETPKQTKTTLTPPPKVMIALDCEMCRTENGPELTRVSLIDHNGNNIYDEIVMPESPIVDYLTQYSGMTPERLQGVTTRSRSGFSHPFIIDTSLVFHHTRGPPYRPGLKWLAQKWLQRHIQADLERGHDSAEDALACMDLVKLKLSRPPGFGEYGQDQESLFSRLHRFNVPKTSVLIDKDAFAGQSATTTIRIENDKEVVAAVPEAIQKHDFVWARLRDIEINHGKKPEHLPSSSGKEQHQPPQVVDTGRASKISSADKVQASEEEIRQGIQSIDKSLKQILESLPARTAVILTSGQGDHREVSRLQPKQKKFMEQYREKNLSEIPKEDWFLEEDERKLVEAVEVAKGGICFFTIK
ncbi:hypothetical protein BGZ65_003354 [Modicella reniformis]|uniref:Exonuclease domain-containing protein n=1 Tax=Modicella reniformis TaxID=1440133 RepID=A0A9P6SV97_9FUNG|nr:hypothetical protein BGZ65_003354 [Modicella reniformis]